MGSGTSVWISGSTTINILASPFGNLHFSSTCLKLFLTSPEFSQWSNEPQHFWPRLQENLPVPDYRTRFLSSPADVWLYAKSSFFYSFVAFLRWELPSLWRPWLKRTRGHHQCPPRAQGRLPLREAPLCRTTCRANLPGIPPRQTYHGPDLPLSAELGRFAMAPGSAAIARANCVTVQFWAFYVVIFVTKTTVHRAQFSFATEALEFGAFNAQLELLALRSCRLRYLCVCTLIDNEWEAIRIEIHHLCWKLTPRSFPTR